MVDREVFDRRLAKLEALLRDLRSLATTERTRFLAERGLQAQAERWLQLAAECAIDLAHHLIADRGWKTPATYREAFEILRAEGVFDAGLADQMQGWAGLRNILPTSTWRSITPDSTRSYRASSASSNPTPWRCTGRSARGEMEFGAEAATQRYR